MVKCAIHQPNFMPWLPYFDKIRNVNVFVFLDDVSYPKSGKSMGSWTNRVKIAMHGQEILLSCPVIREHGVQIIKDVHIDYKQDFFNQWQQIFHHAYGKSANYNQVRDLIYQIYSLRSDFICEFNIALIRKICTLLEIDTEFVYQSDLKTKTKSNELLIEICKKVGADTYLSGIGSKKYMDNKMFTDQKIELVYQDYINKTSTVPHKNLSIIHHLFQTDRNDWFSF